MPRPAGIVAWCMLALLVARPASGQAQPLDAVWVAYRCTERGRCIKGTAFHVGDGVFYTNAHVARRTNGYEPLRLARGEPRQDLGTAEVVCINDRASRTEMATPYDVAKVRVAAARARRLPALKFSRWGPNTNMAIRVIGFPGDRWLPVAAEGVITELLEDQVFAFEVTHGRVTRGSSGSPVLTTRGEVIGMVYAEGSGLLFATAVNWLLDATCR